MFPFDSLTFHNVARNFPSAEDIAQYVREEIKRLKRRRLLLQPQQQQSQPSSSQNEIRQSIMEGMDEEALASSKDKPLFSFRQVRFGTPVIC